jgi:hypothetical protein
MIHCQLNEIHTVQMDGNDRPSRYPEFDDMPSAERRVTYAHDITGKRCVRIVKCRCRLKQLFVRWIVRSAFSGQVPLSKHSDEACFESSQRKVWKCSRFTKNISIKKSSAATNNVLSILTTYTNNSCSASSSSCNSSEIIPSIVFSCTVHVFVALHVWVGLKSRRIYSGVQFESHSVAVAWCYRN